MPDASELLTPTEAAVVAGVSVRDVNRIFDEKILPRTFFKVSDRRWVKSSACAYVRFYFHSAARLTASERSRVIGRLIAPHHGARAPLTVEDDFLVVNFDRFVTETSARHQALRRSREMVMEDPSILGGLPVIRGTRIPVYDIAAATKAGRSNDEVRAAYSRLTDEQIELAGLYASANPPRGRPSKAARGDLAHISETRAPRRPRG